ncbi:MAG: hypothetical protein CVU84_14550 [Firmicutes bacterium HGW-Firmicutes-1]|jgi:hypothetical protein|nr:MAG: hypothetical protein CVU84_14550 [Firmicutes bacterium HGW-Firmicutes-1]
MKTRSTDFIFIISIVFLLTGCDDMTSSFADKEYSLTENQTLVQDGSNDLFECYPNLDESLKNKISELRILWSKFNDEKSDDIDPTEDFHNSEYITKFKNLLGLRESLEISQRTLALLLEQHGLESIDKKIVVGKKEYNIRVIGYNVDFDVKAITDIVDVRDKWIFVQCWNKEEYYFTTLSDGDINIVHDFIPLEINHKLHIILRGYSFAGYPHTPFLWAWHLEEDGFYPSDLLNFNSVETDEYCIYDNIDLANGYGKRKWTFYTNGSYLLAEKRSSTKGSESWPSDYLNIRCEIDEENRIFSFVSTDGEDKGESTIKLKLVNNLFVIE